MRIIKGMEGKMKKTIYIADDEGNIRNIMQLFLTNAGYEVLTFPDGDQLMAAFAGRPADMVILDVMMPGTDGLELCTQIRRRSSTLIVIVSARDSELDRITGITLGSDDYLTKPFSPMELVVRVQALFRRLELDRASGSPEKLAFANFELNTATRQAEIDGKPVELTPTELALMTYLLQNASRAVSRDELLKNVWKFDVEVDSRATDDVVKRLRRKLATAGADLRIESVWGFGFKLSAGGGEAEDAKA